MLKKLCQSVGLASLILVMNYGDLLGGGADVRMHEPLALVGICAAQILSILLLGLVIFGVVALSMRLGFYRAMRAAIVMLAPPYIFLRLENLYPVHPVWFVAPILLVVWAALVAVVMVMAPRVYEGLLRFADGMGIFLALFATCSLVQLAAVMFWRPGPQQIVRAQTSAPAQTAKTHPRLVWILFDELSYDQTFGHRDAGLELPNLDKLRAESTLFTEVQPVGLHTVKVIPSLFSGHEIDDYRFHWNNTLSVHFLGEHGWHRLDGSDTVFGDAQRQGWSTGIVGWYNPYCPVYGDALTTCYWQNFDRMDGGMTLRGSVAENTWRPLRNLARQIVSPHNAGIQGCSMDVRQRYLTDRDLHEQAMKVLASDQDDFVYLHLAVPHSPNMWSRKQNRFVLKCGNSYIDSLALADQELGQMMAVLEASPRWKDTTVIVEGDHSWRVMLWDWLPAWTAEDTRVSHDVFNTVPALLIHNAGQTQPETNAQKIPLTDVHTAIENTLAGRPAWSAGK